MSNTILVDIPDTLYGERVVLRPPHPGDGKAVFEAVEESREFLYPWLPWTDRHNTPEASESFVRRAYSRWVSRDDLALAIWNRETGAYIGGTGLHRINWEIPAFEIGYWIRKSQEGKGYVSEAVMVLAQCAFEQLEAKRVLIRCATSNVRSRAVPERLGFKLEGILRNDIKLADGNVVDTALYAWTDEDWQMRIGQS